jgi:hypothetical protein
MKQLEGRVNEQDLKRLNLHLVDDTAPVVRWRFSQWVVLGQGAIFFYPRTPLIVPKYRMLVSLPMSEEDIKTTAENACVLLNMKDGCV